MCYLTVDVWFCIVFRVNVEKESVVMLKRSFLLVAAVLALAAGAAEKTRRDVYVELTWCGGELEMFGIVEKYRLKFSPNFPGERAWLNGRWRDGGEGTALTTTLDGAGDLLRFGRTTSFPVNESIVTLLSFGWINAKGSEIFLFNLVRKQQIVPKVAAQARVVLYPGVETAFCTWSWLSVQKENNSSIRWVFAPWGAAPQDGLFLKLDIRKEDLAKIPEGASYDEAVLGEMFEAFKVPRELTKAALKSSELQQCAARWKCVRLRFDMGWIGLDEIWECELAALSLFLNRPELAPAVPELRRAYGSRLRRLAENLKLRFQSGTIPLEPLRRKERELAEFEKKYGPAEPRPRK